MRPADRRQTAHPLPAPTRRDRAAGRFASARLVPRPDAGPGRALRASVRAVLLLVLSAAVRPGAFAADRDKGKVGPAPRAATAASGVASPEPETEADALAFVREHHPELAALLVRLKPMKPAEYRRAVRELSQVSRSLAQLKSRDPARYALGLESWKAKSRVQLLAARLAGEAGPVAGLEEQLRRAIAAQVDVEIRRQRHERAQAAERLKRAEEALNRLESRRESEAEARFQSLLKKSRVARRQAASRVAKAAGGETDAEAAAGATAGANGPTEREPRGER